MPAGVEVVHGDLREPKTLSGCLENFNAVYLVWTAPPQTVEPVIEKLSRSVQRFVFLWAPLKTPHPFSTPGIFAGNAKHFWGPQLRRGDRVRWPYLNAATAPIDERDIAAVAVRALLDGGHSGKEYVMTGPEALSHYDQIATIGRALGRSLRIEELTREEALKEWAPIMPRQISLMLLNAWGAAVGFPALVAPASAEITGQPPRTFFEWAMDYRESFATA